MDYTVCVAKTKALISCLCFCMGKIRFSHNVAQIMFKFNVKNMSKYLDVLQHFMKSSMDEEESYSESFI